MTDDEVRAKAESLIGSCAWEMPPEDMTQDQCSLFDSIVFECAICGWYCGTDELYTEGDTCLMVCDECGPDLDDC